MTEEERDKALKELLENAQHLRDSAHRMYLMTKQRSEESNFYYNLGIFLLSLEDHLSGDEG